MAETQLLAARLLSFSLQMRRYLPWTGLGYVVGETLRSVLAVVRQHCRSAGTDV